MEIPFFLIQIAVILLSKKSVISETRANIGKLMGSLVTLGSKDVQRDVVLSGRLA